MRRKRRKFLLVMVLFLIVIIIVVSREYRKQKVNQNVVTSLTNMVTVPETADSQTPAYALSDSILGMARYTILEIQDGQATVSVTSPDLASLFARYGGTTGGTWSSPEEFDASVNAFLANIEAELQSADCPMMTTEVVVLLTQDGNVISNYELADALYGGALTLREQLTEAYEGGNGE